VLLPN